MPEYNTDTYSRTDRYSQFIFVQYRANTLLDTVTFLHPHSPSRAKDNFLEDVAPLENFPHVLCQTPISSVSQGLRDGYNLRPCAIDSRVHEAVITPYVWSVERRYCFMHDSIDIPLGSIVYLIAAVGLIVAQCWSMKRVMLNFFTRIITQNVMPQHIFVGLELNLNVDCSE